MSEIKCVTRLYKKCSWQLASEFVAWIWQTTDRPH